ncbi:endonuclease/exonuclease/phosphatase family protein [Virgibacillus byunsanensis]|uniref:Endonuclease/exonuclease/phosphatase family protein n=1 Tax=Virgibacillus byunsanensis TaxID=570945 RepID=A0ABW3LNJ9_9BACI
MDLKVMTYNIHHGKGTDQRIDLNRIAEVIKKSDAAIVGLTEVDKHFSERSDYEDQINLLSNYLDMDYAFAPSLTIKHKDSSTDGHYGNALLSRYPISTSKIYPFDFSSGFIEGRSILDATVQVNKELVQIHVTHLSLVPFFQRMPINFMIKQLDNYAHPIIIMGDFNMFPGSNQWKKITSEFHDVWHVKGNGKGNTYPSNGPKRRLDYIFASPHFEVMETEVESHIPIASDHLPVKSLLRFK